MAAFYILFEIAIIIIFSLILARSIRRRSIPEISVSAMAAGTVLSGELVNNFHSKVTVYNPSFLFWIPGTGIPVFIICGGILLSLVIFMLAGRFGCSCVWRRLAVIVLISFSFPLIEMAGMGSGLWRWPSNPPVNTGWVLGVWQFYMIFIGLPALVGCVLPLFMKEKDRGCP